MVYGAQLRSLPQRTAQELFHVQAGNQVLRISIHSPREKCPWSSPGIRETNPQLFRLGPGSKQLDQCRNNPSVFCICHAKLIWIQNIQVLCKVYSSRLPPRAKKEKVPVVEARVWRGGAHQPANLASLELNAAGGAVNQGWLLPGTSCKTSWVHHLKIMKFRYKT